MSKLSGKKQLSLEQVRSIPRKQQLKLINILKQKVKKHEVVKEMFDEYDVDLDEIDLIPMGFADLDVSARTDHGTILLNYRMLQDGSFLNDDHYLVHEITHFLQQTTGDGPTSGGKDDYLDNKYEQEGFQNQTEYIADTKGKDVAENYIEQVMDKHEVPEEEKEEKRDALSGIDKKASDIFVYSFVPQNALNEIKKLGLLSGKLVLKNKKILDIARPSKTDQKKFKEYIEEDLKYKETKIFAESVSVFFTLPDFSKLKNTHFIIKNKLVPIQINLTKLLNEEEDIKLLGVELVPFDSKKSKEENIKLRRKFLTRRDVEKYVNKDAKELWKYYDPEDSKHYAADVPHLLIRTKSYRIKPKYIVNL